MVYLIHILGSLYAASVVIHYVHNPKDQTHGCYEPDLGIAIVLPFRGILFSKHKHLNNMSYTDSNFANYEVNRMCAS